MSDVILTVSGVIDPEQLEAAKRGERPRPDYTEIARALDAELLDYEAARRSSRLLGRYIEKALGKNALLAWACFARRGDVSTILSDGEQVGIPLSLLLKWLGRGPRSVRHVMIGHSLGVKKKAAFFEWLGAQSHIDAFLVYASAQKALIEQRFGVPGSRVHVVPFQVDTRFYSPEAAERQPSDETPGPADTPLVCAIGLERRDYPTLLKAVRGLPLRLVITASSAWSKRVSSTTGEAIPDNVIVKKFSYAGLRQLYRDSAFMVMPLEDVDFAAGVTAILEAMAMERAVICSRAPGQTDLVVDGENGVYVPVGDVERMRAALGELLADPERARRLGQRGRRLVDERASLEKYVEALRAIVVPGRAAAASQAERASLNEREQS
jgi:glycosyltransferase involved in cell wall biosynthesis